MSFLLFPHNFVWPFPFLKPPPPPTSSFSLSFVFCNRLNGGGSWTITSCLLYELCLISLNLQSEGSQTHLPSKHPLQPALKSESDDMNKKSGDSVLCKVENGPKNSLASQSTECNAANRVDANVSAPKVFNAPNGESRPSPALSIDSTALLVLLELKPLNLNISYRADISCRGNAVLYSQGRVC